jgi:BirA family biotin operon repressor/biotin-[acetyl-CoA-carboxylase] ligase
VRRFEELDSTNRLALELARAGEPEGVVVVADHQTAGRGRLGRTWVAPPGSSLLMSILLRPDLPVERLHLVVAAVGLSAADAVEATTGVRPGLNWPNDLVVDDRKLSGVLAEREGDAVVVGIGINVNWPDQLPAELAATATAANHLAGRPVDRDGVLTAMLDCLADRYGDWPRVGSEYRRNCSTIGRRVRVELSDETFTGTAADVTDEGHLLVDVGMCLRTVTAGDVVHVRPAGAD